MKQDREIFINDPVNHTALGKLIRPRILKPFFALDFREILNGNNAEYGYPNATLISLAVKELRKNQNSRIIELWISGDEAIPFLTGVGQRKPLEGDSDMSSALLGIIYNTGATLITSSLNQEYSDKSRLKTRALAWLTRQDMERQHELPAKETMNELIFETGLILSDLGGRLKLDDPHYPFVTKAEYQTEYMSSRTTTSA